MVWLKSGIPPSDARILAAAPRDVGLVFDVGGADVFDEGSADQEVDEMSPDVVEEEFSEKVAGEKPGASGLGEWVFRFGCRRNDEEKDQRRRYQWSDDVVTHSHTRRCIAQDGANPFKNRDATPGAMGEYLSHTRRGGIHIRAGAGTGKDDSCVLWRQRLCCRRASTRGRDRGIYGADKIRGAIETISQTKRKVQAAMQMSQRNRTDINIPHTNFPSGAELLSAVPSLSALARLIEFRVAPTVGARALRRPRYRQRGGEQEGKVASYSSDGGLVDPVITKTRWLKRRLRQERQRK
ncbi:hypothetical protein B0H17DRAFT_1123591 [Mycena rosella]|uniref:Uncharacterized protein n=1 Tax=Mycena rosella TaxID=1033263 RepID=A0AAD7H208_MYCRO|nr:hypothetical protein B0H17DRAFT_1123591 [Mycena rosella]